MLRRALKMTFWVTFDHLGKLLVVNVFCVAVLAVPGGIVLASLLAPDIATLLYVGLPVLALTIGLVWPVLAAGIAHMTAELIETRDGSVRAFFAGMRLYAWRAVGVGTCLTMAAICLTTSVGFYAYQLQDRAPWLGYVLSAVALWGLILLLLAAPFAIPALVQRKAGVRATLKLSFLLVLDNPLLTIGLVLNELALGIASLIPPVFVFIAPVAAVVMASSAYEMLSRKYAAIEERGRSGEQGKRPIDFNDAQDDYLNRGLRDFLFPWKS